MSDRSQERFDLSKFVLGYLEEAGSVVTPPEFNVYEVLMPEQLAAGLGIDEYARLSFAAETPKQAQNDMANDVQRLSVNHPLVENISQTITQQPANGRSYIRGVRTDKHGLAKLAETEIELPNARIDPLDDAQEEATQHHYLVCNFKVTLTSEEKEEELVAVVMDLQAGHAVDDETLLDRLAIIDPEPAYGGLPIASPRWQGAGEPLAPETLQALLPRAEVALREKLTAQANTLAARMERHLLLDLARIGDYYDEMTADLEKRQARLAPDDTKRREGFAEKLALLEAERTQKLADARARYRLRVETQLINVLLVSQPKVILPMSIHNRTANITRTVVWDPLLHHLEPLVCDVCGLPGEGLHLCTGGHLAHAECRAPQCIDCKREFCQLCADKIAACVVCGQPVCRPSLIKCPTCGRGTCHEHQQLCHAADGEPAILDTVATATEETAPAKSTPEKSVPEKEAASAQPSSARQSTRTTSPASQSKGSQRGRSTKNKSAKDTKAKTAVAEKKPPTAKGARIDLQIYEDKPVIVAFVMRSTNRVLATRSFELTPRGLLVHCQCEKSPCPVDGYFHRPAPA
ncbi:MAG: hypothetical protein KDE19_24955, partial [Caldilineaceae bacterium]|nr:hypothetical protein [Caldilineaceae bacterium]